MATVTTFVPGKMTTPNTKTSPLTMATPDTARTADTLDRAVDDLLVQMVRKIIT